MDNKYCAKLCSFKISFEEEGKSNLTENSIYKFGNFVKCTQNLGNLGEVRTENDDILPMGRFI